MSTANTNRDGTGTIVDILTAGASGSQIDEVVVQATGDPDNCTVTLFLYNGSAYKLFDEIDLGNPAAASTTSAGYRARKVYDNLVIPTSWKLAAAVTVAPVSGALNVYAFGSDF